MTRNEQTFERFLEILTERPFINYASSKVGISRSTIYRRIENNYRFRQKVNKALETGRKNTVEIAEMAMLKNIHKGNQRAAEFYLKYNSKRYSAYADSLETKTEREDKAVEAFRSKDGKIRVSKGTVEHIERRKENEKAELQGVPIPVSLNQE